MNLTRSTTLAVLIAVGLFTNCDKAAKDTVKKESTSKEAVEPAPRKSIPDAITLRLSPWVKYWQQNLPSFEVTNFSRQYEGELPQIMFEVEAKDTVGNKITEHRLASPDSSLILDLYSYKVVLTPSQAQTEISYNPDAEAVVFDFDKSKKYRLLFTGPAGGIDDGFWLDNNALVITGYAAHQHGISPVYWYIDLSKNKIQHFAYPDTVVQDPHGYLNKKFGNIQ